MQKQRLLTGIIFGLVMAVLLASVAAGVQAQTGDDANLIALGKAMFFDPNLSINRTESCATCHAPEAGFTGPDSFVNAHGAVYEGALGTRFGNRRPPTSAYAGDSPALHFDATRGLWVGGMFWDGRATGAVLGDPLAEQAQGPFLNPLEQAFPDAKQLVLRVAQSEYADLFKEVWGAGSLDPVKDVAGTYERIARSIAAYERSAEVNPYTSKFDLFWDHAVAAGKDVTKIRWPRMGGGGGMGGGGMGGGMGDPYRWQNYRGLGLTDQELQGLASFNDPNRANCSFCHSLTPGADGYPLFTDFSFHNVGAPGNSENPYYGMPAGWNPDGVNWVDQGLGAFLMSAGQPAEVYEVELGKFKVPTLRNVDLRPAEDFVKAFGHNGYFKSTEEIILFYAWRGLVMNGGLGMNGMGMDGCPGGGMGGDMGGGMGGGGGMMEMMCDPNLFPQPEVNQNITPMNHFNMMDQANLATFLKTLSDGYFVR